MSIIETLYEAYTKEAEMRGSFRVEAINSEVIEYGFTITNLINGRCVAVTGDDDYDDTAVVGTYLNDESWMGPAEPLVPLATTFGLVQAVKAIDKGMFTSREGEAR